MLSNLNTLNKEHTNIMLFSDSVLFFTPTTNIQGPAVQN